MPQDTDDLRANLPGLVRSKASSASRLSSGISSRFLEGLTEGLTIGDLDGGRDGPLPEDLEGCIDGLEK